MKPILAICVLLITLAAFAGKGKTALSKGYARDSSTTVTRFSVDYIILNGDSSISVYANDGMITVQLYRDSLPSKVRQGLQRINADMKAELEK